MTAGLHKGKIRHQRKGYLNLFWTVSMIWTMSSTSDCQDYFTGIQSLWDDQVSEWEIYYFNENIEESQYGALRLKWTYRLTWDEWIFQFDDFYGEVKTKWKGDFDVWEVSFERKLAILFIALFQSIPK